MEQSPEREDVPVQLPSDDAPPRLAWRQQQPVGIQYEFEVKPVWGLQNGCVMVGE